MAKKKATTARKYQAGGESRASEKRAQSSMKTYQKPASSAPVKDTSATKVKTVGTLRLEKKKKGGSTKKRGC